jgi:hypothetical protein
MKKFSSITESHKNLKWYQVKVRAIFEGFDPCELTFKVAIQQDQNEGDAGEIADQRMDEFTNLVNYVIISLDETTPILPMH